MEIGRLQSKCAQLESALAARDQELSQAEARYRKYAEKAKEVIKNLEPRVLSGRQHPAQINLEYQYLTIKLCSRLRSKSGQKC